MFWRFFSFVACQFAGGVAGWYLASAAPGEAGAQAGLLLGVVLGGLAWLLMDIARAAHLMRWLRGGALGDEPVSAGWWGEVSDRVRRLVRALEQMSRESQARLQDFLSALQASPRGVVLLDKEGRIEWFNQTAATHFGFEPGRDMLQHIGNLVRDPGFASYFASRDYRHELVMPGRESTPSRPVNLSVHLHGYGEGRLLLLSHDVTALAQAEAMRRDFVANVSHEIRTPLTVLGGFVETLQTLPLSEEERTRYLDLMARQAARMQTLVSDLLTLSRLEGSQPPGFSEWVSVPALMAQLEHDARALTAFFHASTDRLHTLVFEGAGALEIAGVSNELFSAMSNLVGNAIRYTPAGGEIQVRALLLGDGRAEFCVRDTGPGIAPEHLPRLTERFYRVDRSRSRDTGGTGLGLAIVKHVAQRHGAELHIESTPGKGSIFTMSFPANRVRTSAQTQAFHALELADCVPDPE